MQADRFYVYAHIKANTNEVFYVGRGTGKRMYSSQKRSNYWQSIVNKYGIEYKILLDGLTNDEANNQEKYFIKLYGRKKDGGTLCNLTDGGDGLCGYVPTKETLQKQSLALKGRVVKPVDEVQLNNDYKSGLTILQLSEKYNLSQNKISRHLNKELKKERYKIALKNPVKFYKGQTPWNKGISVGVGEQNAFFGKTHSLETKIKMSAKKGRPLICFNNSETYRSTFEAAEKLNLLQSSVAKVARGYQHQTKGYKFKYVD